MATFKEIYNRAKELSLGLESFTQLKDRWNEDVVPVTVLRVEIKPNIWFTWEYHTFGKYNFDTYQNDKVFNENEYLFFKGRYSQITGATQNTFNKERSAFKALGLSKF